VRPLLTKRTVVEQLLDEGLVHLAVLVHADGVELPAYLDDDEVVGLNIGYGLTPPIPDLSLEGCALTGTLSFRGEPFRVAIPWNAIMAVTSPTAGVRVEWLVDEDAPQQVKRPTLKLVN